MSGMVYFALADNGLVKIGRTTNFVRRMRSLKTMSASPHIFSIAFETYDSEGLEAKLHQHFYKFRSHGEWFDFSRAMTKNLFVSLIACGSKEKYFDKALDSLITNGDEHSFFKFEFVWIMLPKEKALSGLMSFSKTRVYQADEMDSVEVIALREAVRITTKYIDASPLSPEDNQDKRKRLIREIFQYSLNSLDGSLALRQLFDHFQGKIGWNELSEWLQSFDNKVVSIDEQTYEITPPNGGSIPRHLEPFPRVKPPTLFGTNKS